MMNSKKVGILADPLFMQHRTGSHVESYLRLKTIYDMLDSEGFYEKTSPIPARPATEEELLLNHSPSHIEFLRNHPPGNIDSDTVMSAGSFNAAVNAVGGCINMSDMLMSREISRGFAFVRPPGHHAEYDRAMGFCLFNNIAICARHLIKNHGLKKIAIVDWDLHHGNGTEHSFYGDSEVFYISTHQSPCYPGTGGTSNTGTGSGKGYNLNIPLPPGSGDEDYLHAFRDKIIPAIRSYGPEIILISAGFDAHSLDPLGQMNLSSACFGDMTSMLIDVAEALCGGRIGFLLEGGYSLDALRDSVREMLNRALS